MSYSPGGRWGWGWCKTHPWTVLALLLLIGHAIPFVLKKRSEWDNVFVGSARLLRTGGDFYAWETAYSYPPFMAFLALPFTFLAQPASRVAWFLVNAVCLAALWRWSWRLSGGRALEGHGATDWREHGVRALGLACSLRYVMNGLAHQQTDLVIAALLIGGCLALSGRRPLLAATGFGLAAAMKCTALLWFPYLLLRRQVKAAAWLLVVAIGANFLPDLVSSPPTGGAWANLWWQRYIRPLTEPEHVPGNWGSAIIFNQSLSGAGNRWLTTQWAWGPRELEVTHRPDPAEPHEVKAAVYATALALVGLSALAGCRQRRQASNPEGIPPDVWEYGIVLLLMVLLSPMSSKPHFSTLFLPGLCLARVALVRRSRWAWLLMGVLTALAVIALPVWGSRFHCTVLWFGLESTNALLLLTGCLGVLLAPGEQPAPGERPTSGELPASAGWFRNRTLEQDLQGSASGERPA